MTADCARSDMHFDRRVMRVGVIASISAHAAIVIWMIAGGLSFGVFRPPVVYSVTLEAGAVLGGKAQVAEKKSELAPMKKVAAKELPKLVPEKKAVERAPAKAPPDAEVSLAKQQQKKAKPTPTPTVVGKKGGAAKPQATPVDVNKKLEAAMQRYLGDSSNAGGKGFGAGALGGKGFGGGVVRPPAFFTYKNLLENHIKSGWRWFDTSASLVAQVEFRLGRGGEISAVRLVKGSGNSEFDDSVLRAMSRAHPAPRPPDSVYQYFEVVTITFDPRD